MAGTQNKRVDEINKIIEQKMIEDSLRQENEAALRQRINRYLQVKPHEIIAGTHFAPVSAEVALLFRDGHYYGCIALTQAVAEALVKFMCQKNSFSPAKNFEENVQKLAKRKFIAADIKSAFLKIWTNRDDFHHLNETTITGGQKLEELALEKARLLADIEREVFAYTIVDGKLNPKYPKYWNTIKGACPVFLRIG